MLAKLILPQLPQIVERQRLYDLLEKSGACVNWISAPAGAGKTTLAAAFAREIKLKTVWYQFDSGDEDPASFFYHLSLAAKQASPRRRKKLSLLTPEYMPGLKTFARNFFRDFFAEIKTPFILILDNYDELKPDSLIHGMIRLLLAELPPGVRVIVTSREFPPAIFADLRAKQQLQLLEWDDLRLNESECSSLARLHADRPLNEEAIRELQRMTDGWMAGLILVLNVHNRGEQGERLLNPYSQEVIADYFQSEVLDKLDEVQQQLLIKTSILPSMTPAVVEELTGTSRARLMLSGLHKSQCFVECRGSKTPYYRYHRLFRDFLQQRLRETMREVDIQALYETAASLFEQEGQIEVAAGFYQQAENWQALGALCCQYGKQMLETGRLDTLNRWLLSLPEDIRVHNPWILFWLGQCRKAFEPADARNLLQLACELFDQAGDGVGAYLAWSTAVETYMSEWNEFRSIGKWMNIFDCLQKKYPDPGSPEAEVAVTAGMIVALALYRPLPRVMKYWEKKCLQLIEIQPMAEQTVPLIVMLTLHWSRIGELQQAVNLIRRFSWVMEDKEISPITKILWGWNQCIYFWLVGEFDAFVEMYSKTLSLAQESGVHVLDTMLYGQAAHCYLSYGKTEQIDGLLEKIAINMNPQHTLHTSLYHYIGAWRFLVEKNYEAARETAKTGLGLSIRAGATFVPVIQNLVVLLIAEFLSGDRQKARHHLARISRLAGVIQADFLRFITSLLEAWMRLEESGEASCLDALEPAMSIARDNGMILYPGVPPEIMSALCAVALKHSICPEHAKQIIRKLNLKPDGQARLLSQWPWRIRVSTMGDFTAEVNGKPLQFGRKPQQRPLALLKYLLCGSGKKTSAERAAAAIWPDSEGDRAHNALKSTVNRLRKLLGADAITLMGGYVWLNRECCWADCWVLESLLSGFDTLSDEEAAIVVGKVDRLYRGDFLTGDQSPWAIPQREELRFRYGRIMALHTSRLLREERYEEVVHIAQAALEKLPCSEALCMNLMRAYCAIGEVNLAVQVYEHCRSVLAEALDAEPGEEIRRYYEEIASI